MPEWLKNFFNRIKEWWLKFTTRQKGIIIFLSVFAVILFIIIVSVVSKPQYTVLKTCETSAETAKVTAVLDSAGIAYDLSSNALTVRVKESDLAAAELALGASGYRPDTYTLEDAQSSALSDTTYDRTKRYQLYMENKLENDFKTIEGVKNVKVNFHIPDDTGTLISRREEASAYIQLDTDATFNNNNATYMAKAAATFLGNDSTANITILNSDGSLLFAGGDDYTTAGIASSMQELQSTAEAYMANQVKKVLYGTSQFNNVEVTSHLNMDYATYEETVKLYYPNDGRTEGMYARQEIYSSDSENGGGGVPGTDSNGEGQSYVYQTNNQSSTSTSESIIDYLPNEKGTFSTIPAGVIDYNKSSLAIAMISYDELSEADAKTRGLLDGVTWNEYKLTHGDDVKLEVDKDFYSMVSTATGVPIDNITIVAYRSPIFYDKEGLNISWTTVLSAALFLLILILLVVVVLRSMRVRRDEPQEEEVSVEDLLQSNPEPTVEDIDVETKSETRKMVEKFVDENPEAAAILLRNWLNEEWM